MSPALNPAMSVASSAELIRAALNRPWLSPGARSFLLDVNRRATRGRLTSRQLAAVERIARAAAPPDFAAINAAAQARLPEVVARLLPAGHQEGPRWHAGSLGGEAGRSLSIALTGPRAGAWCDRASGAKGGDPVSLVAAVAGVSQTEAATWLARMLGAEVGR